MQRKTYKCNKCGAEVIIRSKGLCSFCRGKEISSSNIKKKPLTKTAQKRKEQRSCLTAFFTLHLSLLERSPKSFLGTYIGSPNIANIAHLFPKSICPSVQCHTENAIYLSIQEHTDFDQMLFRHEFARIDAMFPNVMERFEQVLPFVTEKHSMVIALSEYLQNRKLIF